MKNYICQFDYFNFKNIVANPICLILTSCYEETAVVCVTIIFKCRDFMEHNLLSKYPQKFLAIFS
jgi:hypothetical protein